MKIGIDNYSYHRYFGEIYKGQKDPQLKWDLLDFFRNVSEYNPGAEVVSLETCFINHQERKNILDIVKGCGFEIIFSWGHSNGFMDVDIDRAINEITDYIKMSKKIGQKVLRIAASSISYFRQPHSAQAERAVKVISRLKDVAKDYDVSLALENHGDFYSYEIKYILEKVDSDHVGVTFDTGNVLRLKEDCISFINEFREKIYLVHAKDVYHESGNDFEELANLNCVPAGEGLVDFGNVFEELKRNRYNGSVLIEISRLHSSFAQLTETEVINRGMRYLKQLRSEIYEQDRK